MERLELKLKKAAEVLEKMNQEEAPIWAWLAQRDIVKAVQKEINELKK